MSGNNERTDKYLIELQGKYAPSHTGNSQSPDTVTKNTGGNLPLAPKTPNHTGNHQPLGQVATHTGNTEGVTNIGIKTTIIPIPDGPGLDDLAYLDRPANLSPEGSARAGAFNEAKRQSGIPVSQSPSKVYPNVDKRKTDGYESSIHIETENINHMINNWVSF